jgi:hypothetical protein
MRNIIASNANLARYRFMRIFKTDILMYGNGLEQPQGILAQGYHKTTHGPEDVEVNCWNMHIVNQSVSTTWVSKEGVEMHVSGGVI